MTEAQGQGSGKGFRRLRVAGRVRESSLITSFLLEPADDLPLPAFRPGQFLVLNLPGPDGRGQTLRNYSLSGRHDDPRAYRISVKREGGAGPGVPPGLGSTWLHDRIGVGDILLAQGPRGDFVLDESSTRPVVLLSGGVGLTPMVAMLHALARGSDRRVHFLHACEDGTVHALRDEVLALTGLRPGLSAHFRYRAPTPEDRAAGHFHGEGLFTREALQGLLCLDDYDVYLCGPPPFMQALYATLRGLGVARDRIAYEFFGPATVLDPEGAALSPAPAPAPSAAPSPDAAAALTVTFARSGRSAAWDPESGSLLAFAETQGLTPDFSCRAGVCGTCRTRVASGEVTHFEEPLEELAPGELLLCCSRPLTPVVLDL